MRHWQQSSKRALAVAGAVIAAAIVLARIAAAGPPGHIVRVEMLGVPSSFDPAANSDQREFVEGLRGLGYTPGRDIVIDYKSVGSQVAGLRQLAGDLLSAKPDMLVTLGVRPTLAAAKATKTVPIVMIGAADVVETGLVASLARPGGNITGLATNAAEISAKRVQLLQEAVPRLTRVAVLWNATLASMSLGFQNIEKASSQLRVTVQSVRVSGSNDLDRAFAAIATGHPDGLVVLFGPLRGDDLPRIVAFVNEHKIPTIFELGQGVRGGGLMEFGPSRARMARRAAFYVDRIANGAKPADLPVEEPSRFDLVINMKAAKNMGFEVPHSLLLRADRVIE